MDLKLLKTKVDEVDNTLIALNRGFAILLNLQKEIKAMLNEYERKNQNNRINKSNQTLSSQKDCSQNGRSLGFSNNDLGSCELDSKKFNQSNRSIASSIKSMNDSKNFEIKIPRTSSPVPQRKVIRSVKNVIVSFAYSIRNFFIQYDLDKVNDFASELNKFYHSVDKSKIRLKPTEELRMNIGYVCYVEQDDSYFRIKIQDTRPDKDGLYPVLFVDYGDEMTIGMKNIFKLAPEFEYQPYLAINCFIDELWTQDPSYKDAVLFKILESADFFDAVEGELYNPIAGLHPISINLKRDSKSDFQSLTKINLNDIQVLDGVKDLYFNLRKILTSDDVIFHFSSIQCGYRKLFDKFPNFPVNSLIGKTKVKASFVKVKNLSDFLVTFEDQVNYFVTNFSSFYVKGYGFKITNPNELKPGDLVTYKYQHFYLRSLVLENCDGVFEILAFDIGLTFNQVKIENLYYFVKEIFDLTKIEPLAYLCFLDNALPTKPDWGLYAIRMFENRAGPQFNLTFKSFDGKGKLAVSVISKNVDILELLHKCRVINRKDLD